MARTWPTGTSLFTGTFHSCDLVVEVTSWLWARHQRTRRNQTQRGVLAAMRLTRIPWLRPGEATNREELRDWISATGAGRGPGPQGVGVRPPLPCVYG